MDWRDKILSKLSYTTSRLYWVSDPDGLLREAEIIKQLSKKGIEIVEYSDPIAFRFLYEQSFREQNKNICILVDEENIELRQLPSDLISESESIQLSIADVFPDLSHKTINSVGKNDWDALYQALQFYLPGKLSDNASKDFVLHHVYGIAPELIKTPVDLLRMLLQKHYKGIELPRMFDARLIELLSRFNIFSNFQLHIIVPNRQAFFDFLQEQWLKYIDSLLVALDKHLKEPVEQYDADKMVLPFGHDDICIYIDNLFLEGLLDPIIIDDPKKMQTHWAAVGIKFDEVTQVRTRFDGLLKLCKSELSNISGTYSDWMMFSHLWAEIQALRFQHTDEISLGDFLQFQSLVDNKFSDWMQVNFSTLYNQSPIPPVMLHHVPRDMARSLESNSSNKVALLVLDGLAMDQWVGIREIIKPKLKSFELNELCVFAWVPTITSVSRQALFSAKLPVYFSDSIHTTASEEKQWCQFWLDQGIAKNQVFYRKNINDESLLSTIETLTDPRLKVAGLIINTVDNIMHGMQLGSAGMQNQVRQWAGKDNLLTLINSLIDNGFQIFLTSDHGNIEATGLGKINDGSIAESKGERVRVYASDVARKDAYNLVSEPSISWSNIGLPDDYFALIANARGAYINEGKSIVGHGGIALEEVIVPYIKIRKRVE